MICRSGRAAPQTAESAQLSQGVTAERYDMPVYRMIIF